MTSCEDSKKTSAAKRAVLAAGLLGTFVTLSGCAARVYPAEPVYGYTTVTSGGVPYDIYSRPHVYYDGRPTYWVDGRWYYNSPGVGWQYYRNAPPALERQRPYIQQAPPAYRGGYGPQYGPSFGGPQSAPPAVPVPPR